MDQMSPAVIFVKGGFIMPLLETELISSRTGWRVSIQLKAVRLLSRIRNLPCNFNFKNDERKPIDPGANR
jgi:hypothetical protein